MSRIKVFGIELEQKPKPWADYPCHGCYFAHWQGCTKERAAEEGRPCEETIWEAVDNA